MLAGEPYLAAAPELLAARARCRTLIEHYNSVPFEDRAERDRALRGLLGRVGVEVTIMAPFQCDYGEQISIGDRSFINYGAIVLDSAEVSIGADVQIGPGVQLITVLHPLEKVARRTLEEYAKPVRIEDDVWLAAGVIVCPGVTVGAGAVVGAGSVVTRDLPAGHLCLGSPCRAVRSI